MTGIFFNHPLKHVYVDSVHKNSTIYECIERHDELLLNLLDDCYVVCNGRLVGMECAAEAGKVYHLLPRLVGGKGGFGSMLRAIGAQIEKTTNREACRDLSGRRMRDMNNEKKLREWVAKASEREKEKEQRRKDRRERMRAVPNHKFEDPEYHEQKRKVLDGLEESVHIGLQKASGSGEASTSGVLGKRKAAPSATVTSSKKPFDWIGVDMENASDLSSDESADEAQIGGAVSEDTQDSMESNPISASQDEDSSAGPSSSHEPSTSNEQQSGEQAVEVKANTHPEQTDTTVSADVLLSEHPTASTTSDSNDNSSTPQSSIQEEHRHGLLAALDATPAQAVTQETHTQEIDLMAYEKQEDLESLSLDTLKAALQQRGLKCGGTLQQRAERLWAVRGLQPADYPPNLLAKPAKSTKK